MSVFTLILLALGLSFDTLAVSISSGIARKQIVFFEAFRLAAVLGFFQAAMPILGWLGGISIKKYIEPVDHWVALALLVIIGVKMIIESFKDDGVKTFNPLEPRVMVGMALATSIDALAVGVSFAITQVNLILAFFVFGSITFLVAMLGMLFGKKIGNHIGHRMEIIGGLILIGIGVKIVLEHLNG
ncbi:MAG: manganese efflux pump [Bacteroidales bacterium]|jgi:putative Mn2+ efflux pump MntP|nr:manganese efflux pump [Bacteroidales bacterium]HOC36839.1 manganese efflux pump MntP family protein [Tenuifilaceae bacterium]MBP8643896.1 manganese efflux pump [Bacteroidales bacterium]NLI87613.1 manganese efflux pump [Bacteroidales bacterium]HOG72865.1 manganese efflux pump MntP family protein [Tenuifilaceae bacterium]